MSDISISASTPQSMALDNQLAGPESIKDTTSEIASGLNPNGIDSQERTVAGAEVASKTTEFFGAGPDLGSTGTDIDVQQAISSTLAAGMGSIADKIV
jgi:hypothetical protein